MNVKEVKEMLDLAKSKNLFLMEAIWSRFQPAYLKLKELIEQSEIGQVFHVQAEFGMPIQADRVNKKVLGGGVCLDIGIYCVQLIGSICFSREANKGQLSRSFECRWSGRNCLCFIYVQWQSVSQLSIHFKDQVY